jgi:carbon monoxide dehydrogenase subunit G
LIVEGEHTFAGTREAVWSLLLDPEVIAKTMPGTQGLALVAPGRYEGKMRVGVGDLLAADFDLAVTLADVVAPERYTMLIDGLGRLGFTRGKAWITLEASGEGTRMRFKTELEVGGKIAALGQHLLDSVSRLLAKQGLEALAREVEKRLRG